MKPWIVGNWKMNTDHQSGIELVRALGAGFDALNGKVDLGVSPPSIYLAGVLSEAKSNGVQVGAQNCHDEVHGAFTGEVAAPMIADLGCDFVILGHSERRHVFGENAEFIRNKVAAAAKTDLKIILCVGETLPERESGRAESVVIDQVKHGLSELSKAQMAKVSIAYEPVWAIGTGKTASPEQAGQMHEVIRAQLKAQFGDSIAENTHILYGGSVKPANSKSLLSVPGIDGALVGGASLKASAFLEIASIARDLQTQAS